MKLWILRYELAPATIAKIANRTTWGRRYSLPSARRGSSISANSVRNGVNCMATSARPIRVACQRVRDFAPQESSIALPAATLPSGVAIRTHPLKYGALNSPVAKGAGMKFQLKKWQQRLLIVVGVAG